MIKEALIRNCIKEEYQEELLNKAREKNEQKAAKKAADLAQKQEKRVYREAQRKEKSSKISHFVSGIKEKFSRKTEELEEGYGVFLLDGDEYTARILETSSILDSNMKEIPDLKGQDLLKRDLRKDPLFVKTSSEEGVISFCGVIALNEVTSVEEKKGVAYIMFEIEHEYIVIAFKKVETF